jgi:ATP-dependent DNA ligase
MRCSFACIRRHRVEKLSKEIAASFVAFDVLAIDGTSVMEAPQSERRAMLKALLASATSPLYVTPVTREHDVATTWLAQFEGAGLDGVIAKPLDSAYLPGKRAMLKIKHARTADRRRGISLVQGLDRCGRLAAAGTT